jgi:hypothetical protein
MDPYLERSDIWPNVHSRLIVALADDLGPRLRPRYYVAVEERTVRAGMEDLLFAARPDLAVVGPPMPSTTAGQPSDAGMVVTVEVPVPEEITETFIEIRALPGRQVVTVIELLSPFNKRPGDGRRAYEEKRLALLSSRTHLVEIDLLRGGPPMAMRGAPTGAAYRILVSRATTRPRADLLVFGVRDAIPIFRLPLLPGDDEPEVNTTRLLHDLYDRAGFDLRLDYTRSPDPELAPEDAAWADELLRLAGVR